MSSSFRYRVCALRTGYGVFIELSGVRALEPISTHETSDEADEAVRRYVHQDRCLRERAGLPPEGDEP